MSGLRRTIADTVSNRLQKAREDSRVVRLTGRAAARAQRAAERSPRLARAVDRVQRRIPEPTRKRPGSGKDVGLGSGKGGAIGITHPGADSSAKPGRPGQILYAEDPVRINVGRDVVTVSVVNTADRPVTVGSHYHFADANPALEFDREAARGRRQNIISGGMTRFDPGVRQEIELVPYAGRRIVPGFRAAGSGTEGGGTADA
ncbi:urease subunit beta [Actinomadura chokoriensis]|uniref:urease subunit beta n=1 Tax=Actinomadura chokoriensis TaxID=454156 RepID=UPI0031F8F8DB